MSDAIRLHIREPADGKTGYGQYIPVLLKGGDYETLNNKPSIEQVELIGDKSFEDLGLLYMSNEEIENLLS